MSNISKIQIADGIPLTEVRINGKKQTFIIDSGAPCIVLNAKYVAQDEAEDEKEFVGAGGTGMQSNMEVADFEWQDLKLENFTAPVIDLTHLEEELKTPFYGLIGYKELSNFAFCLDYEQEQIELWEELDIKDIEVIAEIPFVQHKHIPLIEVELDGENLTLGLDTGAAANLLDENKKSANAEILEEDTLIGADKGIQVVQKGLNKEMFVNGISFKNMNVVWSNIDHLKQAFGELDGLLGYEFLKQRKMLVSYKLSKIFILK